MYTEDVDVYNFPFLSPLLKADYYRDNCDILKLGDRTVKKFKGEFSSRFLKANSSNYLIICTLAHYSERGHCTV